MSGPIRLAILTVSDGVARGSRRDESGAALEAWAAKNGHVVARREIVPDDATSIASLISDFCDSCEVYVVLSTGGTGFTDRDVTPEATLGVLHRLAPGIPEALRASGAERNPYSLLSRGVAGIRARTLVVNLPGSQNAVRDATDLLDGILNHAVQLLRGDSTTVH